MTELFGKFWGKLLSKLFVIFIILWLICICIKNIIYLYDKISMWTALIK